MKKIILAIIGIVAIALIAVGTRYFLAFNGFLDKITEQKPEMKQYSVVVLNDSELKTSEDLKNRSVGFLKTDPKAANAAEKLESEIEIEIDYFDDIDLLVETLENRIIDAISLESDRLEILKEENVLKIAGDEAEEDTKKPAKEVKIIYTFEIELESENIEIANKEITKEPFIIYVSGSDSRNGIKATARSDVNIVAVVNIEKGKILLVSIPRDTYVQLHDTTGLKDKLTHAGIYGIEMSKTTIEDFLGIKIDYTLKVSFETVVKVVDEVDGIEITSEKEMHLRSETGEKCDYVVGKQLVNGACALRFARERKSYQTGDRHRGENQQQVITSIIGKLSNSKDYVLKLPTILDIASDSFETTLKRDDIMSFIRMQLGNSINWKVESISVDGTGTYEPTYSMGSNRPLYVMIPNPTSVQNAQNKINEYLIIEEPEEDIQETETIDE